MKGSEATINFFDSLRALRNSLRTLGDNL